MISNFLLEILLLAILIGSLEIIFYFWAVYVRKHFQWLITSKDETPILSREGLAKFIPHGYDQELGWVTKPHKFHTEIGKFGTTKWNINENGARNNPGFDHTESKISCYGDSFTFSRQVNDDETWEHYLSKLQKTNVMNFGVGNYGVDQSLLRLKREYPKNKTEIVILAVVPDTICRILSVWKHYYEYGNTFGFKPRFILKENNLHLIKNKIDDESKFYHYEKYLDEIQQEDFFYKHKFKKEILHFPYLINILKHFKRNLPIIFWVTLIQIYKKCNVSTTKINWNPMRIIMQINLQWRHTLYNNEDVATLLHKIIEEFVSYSNEKQFVPVFVFIPQKDDLLFIKKNYYFYEEFTQNLNTIEKLRVLDITKYLLKESDLDYLYSDNNDYGGHLSKFGNEKIASFINDELAKLRIS